MPDTEKGNTFTILSRITKRARRESELQFTSLAHLLDKEFLRESYKSLNGKKAVGVDKRSKKEYGENLEANLEVLVSKLKAKKYRPKASKRVYIPKGEREKRPIGISAIENKIVERALTWILESIYEVDFLESSYGFRRGRNSHQALKKLSDMMTFKPVNHIIEADIRGFFNHVSHDKLIEFIKIRINDGTLIDLLKKFLRAGYVEDGILIHTEEGTPQGSILSPMLANIYLHYVLDEWYEEIVKKHIKGYCELVRYADDFVCVVQYKGEAQKIKRGIENRLGKYELELNEEKTRIISFGRYEKENSIKQNRKANTFDFLGFTHYCTRNRKGGFKVGRKTSRKRFARKCREMNQWLREVRNKKERKQWWKTLRKKLSGHYQYYGVSENYRSVERYYKATIRMVMKWMNRSSQKRGMNWEGFTEYLEYYPLPQPKIVHSFYKSHGW